jgi:hypothetical protein
LLFQGGKDAGHHITQSVDHPDPVGDQVAAVRGQQSQFTGQIGRHAVSTMSLSSLLCKAASVWLQVGVDSVGVDEGELGEGLLPAGGDLAFDEVPFGFAFGAAAEAGFFGAVAGAFVLDAADSQP